MTVDIIIIILLLLILAYLLWLLRNPPRAPAPRPQPYELLRVDGKIAWTDECGKSGVLYSNKTGSTFRIHMLVWIAGFLEGEGKCNVEFSTKSKKKLVEINPGGAGSWSCDCGPAAR